MRRGAPPSLEEGAELTGALEPERSASGRERAQARRSLGRPVAAATSSNNLVLRKHQLDRLKNHTGVRLIVVQAPAGFGKTTLLRQYCAWREAQGATVAWLHLEAHYSDPSRFLRLLCEAVAAACPDCAISLPESSSASMQDFLVPSELTLHKHASQKPSHRQSLQTFQNLKVS